MDYKDFEFYSILKNCIRLQTIRIFSEYFPNFFGYIRRIFLNFAIESNYNVMAKIQFRLSKKVLTDSGRSEIVINFSHQHLNMRAKSGLFVNPSFFEYFIDWRRTENNAKKYGLSIKRTNTDTISEEKAAKLGYELQECGDIVIRQRLENPDVIFHREQKKRLDALSNAIMDAFTNPSLDKDSLTKDWLKDIVERFNHPEKYQDAPIEKKTIYSIIEEYTKTPDRKTNQPLVESHARVFYVLSRAIARYAGYVRATDNSRKDFEFDIDDVTREDIEDFTDYLRHEKELAEDKPRLFEKLLAEYPQCVRKGRNVVEGRGENTIIKMRARLKSVFLYANMKGYTVNRPFEGVKIGTAKVGTPIYITIDERNQIADTDLASIWETMPKKERQLARMPIKTLMEQRDIFVFQCLIGCRVGDLLKMTERYIHNGILVYTPHKTLNEGEEAVQARVPLHPKALSLIRKYRGVDSKGRLFPFITAQRYNDAIKLIFKMAGITRNVEVRNARTGETEIVPINEVASSHLARRTFVGNAYFKVHDPNLIGKMSGHVEGSKAFQRYRKIEDSTLKEVIDLIG